MGGEGREGGREEELNEGGSEGRKERREGGGEGRKREEGGRGERGKREGWEKEGVRESSVFSPKAIAGQYTSRAVQRCSFFYPLPLLRAITGLFNVAHEMSRGSQDPSFPRLGQMLTEYDHALRKISEDFTPLAKVGRKGRGGKEVGTSCVVLRLFEDKQSPKDERRANI